MLKGKRYTKLHAQLMQDEDVFNVSLHNGNGEFFVVRISCCNFSSALVQVVNAVYDQECYFSCTQTEQAIEVQFLVFFLPAY